jgi:hypothetical protein
MSPAEQLQRLLVDADVPRPPPADEPLRFSRLKRFSQSAAHFAYAPELDGSHLDIGSAAHSMLLGGTNVVAFPGKVRRGKEFDAFVADNPDALILSRSEHARAAGMAEAVRRCGDAMRVLDGEREKTFTWKLQGRLCRGTPDVRTAKFITELKTGETADPRFFPFKVRRFCYHGQLAWYSDGAVLAGLPDPQEHYVVAVEAAPPYVVTVFRIKPKDIEQGRRMTRLWFERLLQCEAAQQWPGYSQTIVELDLGDDWSDIGDAGGGEAPAVEGDEGIS